MAPSHPGEPCVFRILSRISQHPILYVPPYSLDDNLTRFGYQNVEPQQRAFEDQVSFLFARRLPVYKICRVQASIPLPRVASKATSGARDVYMLCSGSRLRIIFLFGFRCSSDSPASLDESSGGDGAIPQKLWVEKTRVLNSDTRMVSDGHVLTALLRLFQ